MRIRSTKPEFWRSERIASVDWDARLVLKGLESYVDDNGVGVDDIALIVAEIFPRDMLANASETVARVSDAITHLFQAGLVWRYEAKGKRLLYISFWESIQRIDKPGKGRFPRPDGTSDYGESQIRESVASPRETVAPVTEEQRNRGTEEKEPPYPPRDEPPTARPPATRPKNGAEVVRAQFGSLAPRSLDAYRIAEAFSASLPTPIETGLLSGIGVQIDKCLKRGIPPPAIAAGLQAWTESDSWSPTQIPNFVHKANNRRSSTNGKATAKALGHEEALAELLQEVTTL
ncbi:MAG: hypothetical protein K2X00_24115 [Nitrospiraceae bacterium]|nr:hypothetical protein [Nitrospiraceae bacterium]